MKLFPLYFLIKLVFYQIVFNIFNRECRASPFVELVVELDLNRDGMGMPGKFIAKVSAWVVFELVEIVAWIINRNVIVLKYYGLVKS